MAVEKSNLLDVQERDLLKSAPLLAGLPDAARACVLEGQIPVTLERGTVLFHQGQPTSQLYIVLRGWIRLYRTGVNGAEAVISIAGPGDIVGDPGLIRPHGYLTSAEAISPARVISIDGNKLTSLMRRDPAVAAGFASALAQHVLTLTKHLEVMKLLDAKQRTAHFLLTLCPVSSGACSLTLPYEKAVIAGWLGMKPASLSRALFRLRKHGVTVERDTVLISDAQRLAQLSSLTRESRY